MLLPLAGEGLWVLYCWGTGIVSPTARALLPLVVLLPLGGWSTCTASAAAMDSLVVQACSSQGRELNSQRRRHYCTSFPFSRAMERGVCRTYLTSAPHSPGLRAQLPSREMGSPSTISAFPQFCLLCEFKSTHFQIYRCVNLRLSSGLSRETFVELWISQS